MLSQYIVLVIMSILCSYSVLGLVPGLILTVFVAVTVFDTGLIITDFCEKFPHLRNVCDIGQYLLVGIDGGGRLPLFFSWAITI